MPHADIDRRTFLKGAAGSTAAMAVTAAYSRDLLAQETDYMRAGFSFFSPTEVPTVEALAEQIWPGDDDTVGGRDAGVAVYIDRALSGAYIDLQPVYRLGLDWVNQAANEEFGDTFAELEVEQQIAFLETHLGMPEADTSAATPAASPVADATPVAEADTANVEVEGMPLPGAGAVMIAGGEPPDVEDVDAFLQIVRTHVIEGLFADPVYGGNRDKRVWADLQYGGPYYVHTEEQQMKMDGPLDLPIQSIADL